MQNSKHLIAHINLPTTQTSIVDKSRHMRGNSNLLNTIELVTFV